MSHLLGLDVPDHQAINNLRRYLENGPATPSNLNALTAAKVLEQFFFNYGEHINHPGYIRREPDLNTPIDAPLPAHEEIEQTEAILAEQIYVPPSAEQIIADQVDRISEITIQYNVGDIAKLVSYKLSALMPPYDMSGLRPHISVDVDPRVLQERIAKVTDRIAHKFTQHHKDDTRGIGVKKAMEIADNPEMHNFTILEKALQVLRDHILTQPYSSDIASK